MIELIIVLDIVLLTLVSLFAWGTLYGYDPNRLGISGGIAACILLEGVGTMAYLNIF